MNARFVSKAQALRTRRMKLTFAALTLLSIAFAALYQFAFVNPKFFDYAMGLRAPRLAAIVLSAFAIAAASLVFQTLIRNHIVTPCLLGMNSLYVLVHTAVVFFLGTGSALASDPLLSFGLDLIVMSIAAYLVYNVVFEKAGGNVLYILLVGTVLSTFFSSVQTSLTRLMDPHEYDALLSTLVANFGNVNAVLLAPACLMLLSVAFFLRRDLAVLDVLGLGRDQAINLGVDYNRTVRRLMLGVALYIAAATALVGPVSFLGLITSNLARRLFPSFRHGTLIAGSVLLGVAILLAGQFIVEHLALYRVPVSVFITIGGGLYFLYLIVRNAGR